MWNRLSAGIYLVFPDLFLIKCISHCGWYLSGGNNKTVVTHECYIVIANKDECTWSAKSDIYKCRMAVTKTKLDSVQTELHTCHALIVWPQLMNTEYYGTNFSSDGTNQIHQTTKTQVQLCNLLQTPKQKNAKQIWYRKLHPNISKKIINPFPQTYRQFSSAGHVLHSGFLRTTWYSFIVISIAFPQWQGR